MNQQIELRPEVLAFARLMEQRLREKDADKGQSWKTMHEGDLEAAPVKVESLINNEEHY